MSTADLFGKVAAPRTPKTRTRRVCSTCAADVFLGYEVTGYSPQMIEAARRAYERRGLAWDEAAYLRKTRPARVCPHAYELRDGAQACATLAQKAGWKKVRVEEILRVAA